MRPVDARSRLPWTRTGSDVPEPLEVIQGLYVRPRRQETAAKRESDPALPLAALFHQRGFADYQCTDFRKPVIGATCGNGNPQVAPGTGFQGSVRPAETPFPQLGPTPENPSSVRPGRLQTSRLERETLTDEDGCSPRVRNLIPPIEERRVFLVARPSRDHPQRPFPRLS